MIITERKHTELQLQESEARFRNVTTNLPGAVFRYGLRADGTDHITLMNQGCFDIWEITPDQVVKRPALLWEMMHEEDRDSMWSLVQQSAETLAPWLCEWRITTASGRVKWLQGMGHPERQPNGDMGVGHADPGCERSQKRRTSPQPNQPSAAIFSRQYPGHGGAVYCRGSLPEGE